MKGPSLGAFLLSARRIESQTVLLPADGTEAAEAQGLKGLLSTSTGKSREGISNTSNSVRWANLFERHLVLPEGP